jgi:hypothetical protein
MRPQLALEALVEVKPMFPIHDLGTISSDNIEIDVQLHEAGALIEEFEELTDATGNVMRLQGIVMESINSGAPLSKAEARMLQVAYECACPRRFRAHKQVLPAMENFDNTNRLLASRSALESVMDGLKRMAAKIAEWMIAIWKKISKFFSETIFNRTEHAKKKIVAAQQEVKQLAHDAKPANEYIGDKSVALEDAEMDHSWLEHHIRFGIKGRCDAQTTHEIIDNTMTLIAINREIIVHMLECMKNITDDTPTDSELESEANRLVEEIKDKMTRFDLLNKKHEENITAYSYGHFHDGNVFRLKERVGISQDDPRVRLFNIDLEVEKVKEPPYKVKVLSIGEMGRLAVETMRLVERSDELKKVIPIAEKILHSAAAALDRHYVKATELEDRKTITLGLHMVQDLFRYVAKHLPSLTASAVRVAEDSSTYVRASVFEHKKV